jgi:hypothetical protein
MWWAALLNSLLGTLSSGVPPITGSYESIASATGTGSSGVITFSSIPSTYQHLQIRAIMKGDDNNVGTIAFVLTLNNDTGSNYAYHELRGDGSSATAAGSSSQTGLTFTGCIARTHATQNDMVGAVIIDIQDYISSTKNKTVRTFGGADLNSANGRIRLASGLWMNTAAITTLTFTTATGNFTSATQFALYGIKG